MSEIKSGIKVEKEVPNPMQDNAKEVATDSQDQQAQPSPEVGDLIAESKKYRERAQVAETRLAEFEKSSLKQKKVNLKKKKNLKPYTNRLLLNLMDYLLMLKNGQSMKKPKEHLC